MDNEELQRKLKLYQELDSEWLRAYRLLHTAETEEQEQEAFRELEALRTGNSWADLNAEPIVKVVVDQRDAAHQKLNKTRVQIELLIAYLQTDTHSAGVKLAQTEKGLQKLVENL